MTPKSTMRILSWVMFVALIFSVLVNVNDPDPMLWIAVYGAAALACGLDLWGRGHWLLPGAIGLGTLVWGATLAPEVIGRVPFSAMFGAWEMENLGIERSREMYGLLIIAVWMGVLTLRAVRRGRHPVGVSGST